MALSFLPASDWSNLLGFPVAQLRLESLIVPSDPHLSDLVTLNAKDRREFDIDFLARISTGWAITLERAQKPAPHGNAVSFGDNLSHLVLGIWKSGEAVAHVPGELLTVGNCDTGERLSPLFVV